MTEEMIRFMSASIIAADINSTYIKHANGVSADLGEMRILIENRNNVTLLDDRRYSFSGDNSESLNRMKIYQFSNSMLVNFIMSEAESLNINFDAYYDQAIRYLNIASDTFVQCALENDETGAMYNITKAIVDCTPSTGQIAYFAANCVSREKTMKITDLITSGFDGAVGERITSDNVNIVSIKFSDKFSSYFVIGIIGGILCHWWASKPTYTVGKLDGSYSVIVKQPRSTLRINFVDFISTQCSHFKKKY